jgi:diaminopimelate epimerase
MHIPFTKAHGAKNDFLLTWASQAPSGGFEAIARAICDRHTGMGADGWMLVRPADEEAYASIRLFNSDGSEPELSGNGTRCAAALLVDAGYTDRNIPIVTGAGLKRLRLLEREDNRFLFEMNMGQPSVVPEGLRTKLELGSHDCEVTIIDVGNPQCALFVKDFPTGWEHIGAEIESHSRFENRTNVSFIRPVDEHTIDVRFFERGVGVTMSSGTGSTGAAAAAIARGVVQSPVRVLTPAGELQISWDGKGDAMLVGPAEIIARGEFYMS